MPAGHRRRTLLLFAVTLLLAATSALRADTYSATVVAYTDAAAFHGIDAAGDFVIDLTVKPEPCGAYATSCYETVYYGHATPVFTTYIPDLVFDNGSACKPTVPAGFFVDSGVCNNGHSLISGYYNFPDGTQKTGVWGGPDPDPIKDYLSYGLFFGAKMNANGDAVYIDPYNDTLVFADDLSTNVVTPEPASLLLLASGSLTLVGAARRRLRP